MQWFPKCCIDYANPFADLSNCVEVLFTATCLMPKPSSTQLLKPASIKVLNLSMELSQTQITADHGNRLAYLTLQGNDNHISNCAEQALHQHFKVTHKAHYYISMANISQVYAMFSSCFATAEIDSFLTYNVCIFDLIETTIQPEPVILDADKITWVCLTTLVGNMLGCFGNTIIIAFYNDANVRID